MTDKESYTIKEVMEQKFSELHTHLDRIEEQTSDSGKRLNSLENHRAYLWGAYTVLVLLGGTIIAFSVVAIDNKIQKGIVEALANAVAKVEYEN